MAEGGGGGGGMGWIGGVIGMVVSGKQAVRNKAIGKQFDAAAKIYDPFISRTAGDLKKWGEEDWNRFKETYRPTAEALVADANREPDNNRYEKEATIGTSRELSNVNAGIRRDASRTSAGPNSGRFLSSTVDAASGKARAEGIGQARGRQIAGQESVNKKLNVIGFGKPDPSASIAGLGAVVKGGADYGKYATEIGQRANENWGGVAQGFGKAVGSYRGSRDANTGPTSHEPTSYQWGDNQSSQDDFNSQNDAFGSDYSGPSFAAGGIIEGPGTGRSDSIPAVIDGRAPARVSDGEYHIDAAIVARIGKPRLDALISIAR